MPYSQKGFASIAVVIILLVVVGVAAYLLLTRQANAPSVSTPAPAPMPMATTPPAPAPMTATLPTPSASQDETAGWKIYRNDAVAIEFKYPSDWKVREDFYRTPAQEAEGTPPSLVGITLIPTNQKSPQDIIQIDQRQFTCRDNGAYRCIRIGGHEYHTDSKNTEILKVFDLITKLLSK